jgi:hypothetical protein
MAISQAVCTSFKQELLQGIHNFTNGSGGGTTTSTGSGNTFKLALYTSSASLGAATTAFTTSNEASGTGYSSGGSGVAGTSALGSVNIWSEVDPSQTPNYQAISTTQTPNWTDIAA